MIYAVAIIVFSGVIMLLVGMLLVVEARVVRKGDSQIIINQDADHVQTLILFLLHLEQIVHGSCHQ